MEANAARTKQLDHLLAQVEVLQQEIAQLYVELQSWRETKRSTEPPEAPAAAAPGARMYHGLRPVDRRASPRRQANQVSIGVSSALDDAKPFTGWVLDYSLGGLGLFVDKKIPIGSLLHVQPAQSAGRPIWKEVAVKNCQRYLDGWRLGCRMEDELTADDLRRFGLE